MNVKITKLAAAPTAEFKSGEWKDWIEGYGCVGKSLPVEYTLKGTTEEFTLGEPMWVKRTERNGVAAVGLFVSSNILEIAKSKKNQYIRTQNSIYMVEEY